MKLVSTVSTVVLVQLSESTMRGGCVGAVAVSAGVVGNR